MYIDLDNLKNVFLVGIKGSGLCSLACFLNAKGYFVEGVDVHLKFYTEDILNSNNITYYENIYEFSLKACNRAYDILIYSPAYDKDSLNILLEARELRIPILSYPEIIGKISSKYYSIGVAGSHGKTTTTAFLGILFSILGLEPNVILGASVKDFGNKSSLVGRSDIFIAETCEYRNHFLNFSPNMIVLTNVNYEHVDFFESYEAVEDVFLQYINNLKKGGVLIINADEVNLIKIKNKILRRDIKVFSFGFNSLADFKIERFEVIDEFLKFDFLGGIDIELRTPLMHNVLNFSSALLAVKLFLENHKQLVWSFDERIKIAAKNYMGVKRRLEFVMEKDGVIYLDDYAHHPKEIENTLLGVKNFYKDRRIILDFMPHTFTRTKVLFNDFVKALSNVDVLILHNIYLSGREDFDPDKLSIELFLALKDLKQNVYFFKEVEDSVDFIKGLLKENDLFITMGAGNNFILHDFL
ncbi:UDP-N-acetylmuramate--L-alanine ligase [Borrelia miyamotoi]|uniref:UDP-N-acetylmuramate--L-alanine ligase n=1 Tax=Borrelia miyamotoi TaxID=47466 RepID=A0AAQ2WWC2_9SPIR|nr:UDP-N-acetylmuramate--L-alanine ligase [Borrelia miyamotoi]AGT27756.1 UDP-N-acetylmuramate--alanine ligase [Borrelia miyamotoi LB-2001]AJA58902.1 UDP-N-acetylmuramate--alanine ligase [Borrelia miyamotoi]AOW95996.1 UDP-N-acetylmuramate--L-alanine ligase [Borrelia miyamotoi]QTL83894.1 UDP-N-acetylmuramate--L-alanine ligase [Borrelia miyamotoi]WAZ84801.1 UDP-N-acetylmuramate--L-alanine ligase [Borrelia miyamotoi]